MKSISEFYAKYCIGGYRDIDLMNGRVLVWAARIAFFDNDQLVSVAPVNTVEKAVKAALAAERETVYKLEGSRHLVGVSILKSGHYMPCRRTR